MASQPQFNIASLRTDGEAAKDPAKLIAWLNVHFLRLSNVLKGPNLISEGEATATKTLKLWLADLTKLTLAGNTAITLHKADTRAGAWATLELTQDATGGRIPTWVNATGTGGAVTAPTATANKKTLYFCVYNGTNWVLSVLASNYT